MPVTPLKTPTKLGRYEIVDELGKGAMGVVYLARDPLIGRLVALKTFRIGYSVKDQELEQFRARFMREAQSAGILSHPAIVTVHDVVEEGDDGLAFIAMEYVRGTNLKLLLQREAPLDLAFVAGVIDQVADALDYAHSRGVIHRDVKPANIIITADNQVKITDFGIARLDSSNLTQEGQLLGTPNYMAPEQILGREIDHRADLFSLGVVLYEMLTRRKPFQGENLTVVSHRIVYDHFTPPETYVADLPAGLNAILSHALQKEPEKRYQHAREMASDLNRLVADRAARESLNETQSLSGTAVVLTPPPAQAPPPKTQGGGWGRFLRFGRRAATPSSTAPAAAAVSESRAPLLPAPPPLPSALSAVDVGAIPSQALASAPAAAVAEATPVPLSDPIPLTPLTSLPPLTPLTPMTPAPAAPAPRVAWHRLATVAGVTAGIALLVLTLAALVIEWRQPAGTGQVGPPGRAAAVGATVAPELPGLRKQREEAARQAEQARLEAWRRDVEAKLGEARQALAGRRYPAAAAAAEAALALDPTNAEAQGVLADAEKAEAQKEERPAPRPANPRRLPLPSAQELPPARPSPAPQPATAPVAAAAPTPADAKLQVHLYTALSTGVLTIYLGDKQIMQDPFDFSEKGGLFRPRKPGKGTVEQVLTVPAGAATLRIYLTPDGRKALVYSLSGNFPGGSQRRLSINLTEDGTLSANLE